MKRVVPVVLLALLVLATGCVTSLGKKGGSNLRWSQKRVGNDHYLGVQVRGRAPGSGFILLKRNLWPPFRWEVTYGVYGGEASSTGTFGSELDAVGSSPLQFYGISAQYVSGGLNVFAASHLSAPGTHGSKFYPGVRKVDVAIEHDGSKLRYYSRPHGTGASYDLLAEIDVTGQMLPVRPTVGVFHIEKQDRIGFDHFRVAENGMPPAPSAEDEAVAKIFQAVDAQVDAFDGVDGETPNPTAAVALLADSRESLDAALAKVDEILAGASGKRSGKTGPAAAKKFLLKARKKLLSAKKKLERSGKVKNPARGLKKIIVPEFDAALALKPDK